VGDAPERVIREAEADGDPQQLANGLSWAMDRAFALGDLATALAYGRRLLGTTEFVTRSSRFEVGRIALHAGDVTTAELVAIDLEPTLGGATEADVASLRAGIAAARGRTAEALAGYRTALTAYRDLGLPFDVALTGLDMAVLVGVREPAALQAVSEARVILAGLGAAPLVARIDALPAPSPAVGAAPDRASG
jgi:hypothetical protein